jgi:nicotinamidase-related amidase
MKISRILISGFLAEYCILKSSISAVENKFKVYLVTDCVGTSDDTQGKMFESFEILKRKNVEFIVSEDLYHSTG